MVLLFNIAITTLLKKIDCFLKNYSFWTY